MSRVFIDIVRPELVQYSEIMEALKKGDATAVVQEKLEDMVENYPDFLEPYNTLYAIYQINEDFAEADVILNRAYNRAHNLILDAQENLPDLLEWKHGTNQHIIKTIYNKGIDFWMDENKADAKNVFESLIKINPEDSIGARFYLLALKKGFAFEAFMNRFMKDGYLTDEIKGWYEENKQA